MSTLLLLGLQWGDEGKGKIVDAASEVADVTMRFQGGANSGHTIYYKNVKVILHHIPSAIFHEGKISIMGAGMVVTPEVVIEELRRVEHARGTPVVPDELAISPYATIIFPVHRGRDAANENSMRIGTTGRGIGPAYEDRIGRRALLARDVATLPEAQLKPRLETLVRHHVDSPEEAVSAVHHALKVSRQFKEVLAPFVRPVKPIVDEAIAGGRRVLFEGAQGTMLDIMHGTYPYVTSSMTTIGGVFASIGSYVDIARRVGLAKAYCTRVGEGPFPSELSGPAADALRDKGQEYGATTGRPRRVGWLDLVQLRFAVEASGIQDIVLTKADVLSGYKKVGLVTAYQHGRTRVTSLESGAEIDDKMTMHVEYMPGWAAVKNDQGKIASQVDAFCRRIESFTGARVAVVSYGPERSDVAFRYGTGFEEFYA